MIDEAHKIYTPSVIEEFKPKRAELDDDDAEDIPYKKLIQFHLRTSFVFNFSATLNKADLVYNYSLLEGVADRMIFDYRLHIVIMEGTGNVAGTTFQPNFYKNYIAKTCKKCLVYCNNMESCKVVASKLGCRYLDGQMNNNEREDIISDFRVNQLFLVSCRTICEGVDLPFIDGCVFAEERASQVNIIQCIGRA